MSSWNAWQIQDTNVVTAALLAIVAVSMLQGIRRGAPGSAKQLFFFLASSLVTVAAVVLSAVAASALSPRLYTWLTGHGMPRPDPSASVVVQFGYTIVSGLRDLPLFRFAVLILLCYSLIRLLIGLAARFAAEAGTLPLALLPSGGWVGRAAGGAIGTALGAGRALLFTAILFGYCAISPQGPMTGYIQQSGLYQEVAAQVIRPAAGSLIEQQLPVFARKMSKEMDELWLKRYDVIDAELPDDIVQAAKSITEGKESPEAKARALYDWVGTRITYDNEKVLVYETKGEWREQNPEQTFATRKGVCIDYARLYAAMARAVDLEVRVVTGQGYDGRGGYGAHAWNEVYLPERQGWVPLDPTWAQTGNWFDPPRFSDTHIRQA
ncbi:transglutaminase domain-containing protein [Cohnella pontilimi]|uniref:Transglutaminase domain-containing protein n=1 Tax=Cohnella pontilimi TaxID=2564100 RepID=A0A4U0F9L8_9BACL|nr:transglutaminase-like domain-containing protein [Cohnella pontilimi]TJY39812.1 transglutaminase domain-containing protein [Cohnella pontilimi]